MPSCHRFLYASKIFSLLILLILCSCSDMPLYTSEKDLQSAEFNGATRQTDDYYPGTEQFGDLTYNPFHYTLEDSLSTFAIDVDNGSYTFSRKKLNQGILPDPSAVRVEEFINYFDLSYAQPDAGMLAVYIDGALSPFRDSLHLLRVGIKGRDLAESERKTWNITFLVDISGSMSSRLPLVKYSLNVLVDNMQPGDKISLCTYAGGVNTLITPTTLDNREAIKAAINSLESGGGTSMASGIQNAYDVNTTGFIEGGVNRVVVASDGDANIGPTTHQEILTLISAYVAGGTTLSTLGYGSGNYNDHMMEQLANNGNGNYNYVDSEKEADLLFTDKLAATMQVIAKDVKLQINFYAQAVEKYRLIGYENRGIPDSDFVKDETDAGELGSGHTVTALYELVLKKSGAEKLGSVSLIYKNPTTGISTPLDIPLTRGAISRGFSTCDNRFQFIAGVAEFAEILRESPYATGSTLSALQEIVEEAHETGNSKDEEFLQLLEIAAGLM